MSPVTALGEILVSLVLTFKSYFILITHNSTLAFRLVYLLSLSGSTFPARLAAFAPDADLTHNYSDYAKAQIEVDLIPLSAVEEMSFAYINGVPSHETPPSPSPWKLTDPLVSAAYIPTFPPSWPSTLIFVGTADTLIDGSRILKANLDKSRVKSRLVEVPGATHGFWLLAHLFPNEAKASQDELVAFINE